MTVAGRLDRFRPLGGQCCLRRRHPVGLHQHDVDRGHAVAGLAQHGPAFVTGVAELLKLALELTAFSCPREVAALPEQLLAEPCRLNVPSSEMARPATLRALHVQANPRVALTIDTTTFPPHVPLVRGTARVEVVDGAPFVSSPWATAHADRSKTPDLSTSR